MENQNEETKLSPLAEKAKELLTTLEMPYNDSSLIQDNKILFTVDGALYRCRMPSQREKTLAEDKKNRIYGELLEKGGYKTRKQLKHLLKEHNNIDIDQLEAEKNLIQEEIKNSLYLSLATKTNDDIETIDSLKKKIEDLRLKHIQLALEISTHLCASIEDRLEKEFIEYIAFLCTEKADDKDADKWNSIWTSYDEFQNANTKVETKAIQHTVILLLNSRE
jgi:hypothetical protein